MKVKHLVITAFTLVLFACNIDSSNDRKAAQNLIKTKVISFSDTTKLDTFRLVTVGKNADDIVLVFTITANNGKIIYTQKIAANDLLKSYLASADLKKEGEKEKFIKEEVDFFFDEEHFLAPAVTENETPDQNTPDINFYNELKNTGLNGFTYRLGKDKKYYIAWSAKEQKVKIYYQCC